MISNICQKIRPPLVALLFIVTLVFYAGTVQSWLWQVLILALFMASLVDLTPSIREYIRPWLILLLFLFYCWTQGAAGMKPVMEGQGIGSYYPWETFRCVSYMGYFVLLGLCCGLILRSQGFLLGLMRFLAGLVFISLVLCFVQGILSRQFIFILWRHPYPTSKLLGPFFNKAHFSALIVQIMPMFVGFLHWRWLSWEKAFELDPRFRGNDRRPSVREYAASFLKSGLPFLFSLIGFMFFMVYYAMGKICLIILATAFLIYLFWLLKSKRKISLAFLAVLFFVFIVLSPSLPAHFWAEKFVRPLKYSTSSRIVVLLHTLNFWHQHPYFGTGLGTYSYISSHFIQWTEDGLWAHAHNDYAEILLETGIFGTGLLVLMIILCIYQGTINFRKQAQVFWKIMTLQSLVSLGLFAILEMVDFHARVPINAMVLIMQISILFVPPPHEHMDLPPKVPLANKWGTALFLIAALWAVLFLGVFAYNQYRYETFIHSQSMEVLQEGVKEFPESADMWDYLGRAYMRKAKLLQGPERLLLASKAVYALENAVRIVPSFPFYWQYLSYLQKETGQYEAAQKSSQKALYWGPHSLKPQKLIKK